MKKIQLCSCNSLKYRYVKTVCHVHQKVTEIILLPYISFFITVVILDLQKFFFLIFFSTGLACSL